MLSNFIQWAFSRQDSPTRIQAFWRATARIFIILGHVFIKTDIPLRASALTYSIILSLVPMLAMSTAILKGLGNENELKVAAYRLIDQLEPSPPQGEQQATGPGRALKRTETTTGAEATDKNKTPQQLQAASPASSLSLLDHLRDGVNMIFAYVDRTNFAALGAFGIVGLLFVVLLMLNSIETTMNAIWHSGKSRPLGRKIMDYLALLVLLPISLNVAFAGDAILRSPSMMAHIGAVIPSPWLIKMLFKGLPFLFIVGCLTFMYRFFPYARVRTYAALSGAIFSAVCWFLVQQLYITLQIGVAKYNAIYGSFATIPLFLIWLNLGWIFLLLGAALAYAVQNRNSHQPLSIQRPLPPRQRLQQAIDILQLVYRDFQRHQATTLASLMTRLPDEKRDELERTCKILCTGGILHRTRGKKGDAFVPAQPHEQLDTAALLNAVWGAGKQNSEQNNFSDAVIKAAAAVGAAPFIGLKNQGTTLLPDPPGDPHASGE